MSCFFIDLDGTIFRHGSNELLPGARERIDYIIESGGQIIFVTRRGREFEGHPVYNKESTLKALKELNIPYRDILFDVPSPRIIVNDDGCQAINVTTNAPCEWNPYYERQPKIPS